MRYSKVAKQVSNSTCLLSEVVLFSLASLDHDGELLEVRNPVVELQHNRHRLEALHLHVRKSLKASSAVAHCCISGGGLGGLGLIVALVFALEFGKKLRYFADEEKQRTKIASLQQRFTYDTLRQCSSKNAGNRA